MAREYSLETIEQLTRRYRDAGTERPMRVQRYEPGTQLTYDMTGVVPARGARVTLEIDRFVGGGFAGQVYRVRVMAIEGPEGPPEGLEVGGVYAMKILIPPSRGSQVFRDLIYRIGFQAPFALQVNPAAARAGALWQKFIRRAAAHRFDDEQAVVDVLATFVDPTLGSCGELSEWVEGRTWRFEVDDQLGGRKQRICAGRTDAGSGEYIAKKVFMRDFVAMLHEIGAHEFARQYEWWTCKSQPNALKRLAAGDEPAAGLTAVDFRAGLALLPVLPMSPGDVPLIVRGIARGSLVQFDRGDLDALRAYVSARAGQFADMHEALDELIAAEEAYRSSQIDLTHHRAHLLYDRRLWGSIFDATVKGWRVANEIDDACEASLRPSCLKTAMMAALLVMARLTRAVGLVGAGWKLVYEAVRHFGAEGGSPDASVSWTPLWVFLAMGLVAPPVCRGLFRLIGRGDRRRHLWRLVTSRGYFVRAVRAHMAESLIRWHRVGRVDAGRALALACSPLRFAAHLPLSLLPVFLHRMLTDGRYVLGVVAYVIVRPVKLYFNAQARETWLREMVTEGQRRHILTDRDAETILSRIDEPFIQKYLKSLAVHVCTLPVTQVVSVAVATWFYLTHPEMPETQRAAAAGLIIGAFQITPISPGSLTRGLYVLWLVIRERNYKDYNIAVFLGFFKYVGYLAFPIQMAYRYPALARFMAAHWATGAVHIVPVFGEHGALMEHAVFDLFYNYPLSVRRRLRAWADYRQGKAPRVWHAPLLAATTLAVLGTADVLLRSRYGALPTLGQAWPLTILAPWLLGSCITRWAGGATLGLRVKLSAAWAAATGALYAGLHTALRFAPALGGSPAPLGEVLETLARMGLWAVFLYALLATVATLVTEARRGDPPQ